ncbi:TerD family protein [Streptacidiphilus sp. ASG 303]|uniref:TerD family protein n=1 Tax=Streptacidiphilus sp. ASG 303 TaxID=2896847 RepID=UPI001E53BC44|nr:TerD family protein [Streptacidiphilus sp. ASG 303]MCD0482831.1 TerD family protein [Streptacidiphilus sp. ASG 303]
MTRELVKAARVRIGDLTPGTDLYIGVQISAPGLSFDISCFGLDAAERLSDDRYFVFFNQPASPEGSVRLLGAQSGDTESFRLLLDQVPEAVHKLSLTATVDGDGRMSQVSAGCVRIVAGGEEVGRYSFTGAEFSTERAVMLADVYRKGGEWRFAAVGQGFDGGLRALLENFGGEVLEDDAPQAPAPTVPAPTVPAQADPAGPARASVPAPAPAPAPAGTPAGVPAGSPVPPHAPAPAPAQQPGVKVSLVKYAEVPEQSGWVQQNPNLVRVTVTQGRDVLALHGSMVAYQGKADFAHESSGMLRRLTANLTGQQLRLMRVSGEGQVFLADEASQLHVVRLEGDALCVSADRVLAFDAGIEHEVRRIEGEGLPNGGLHTLMFGGHGTVVIKTNGTPVVLPVTPAPETHADAHALVAWTRGAQVITTAPVRIRRSAYAGHAAESYSLQFRGAPGNFIVVQPFEV